MRRKRTIIIAISVLAAAAAIALAVYLRKLAAPEPARLLPNADAFIYVNLKPLRQAGVIGQKPAPISEPEYAQFVQETGFQFERDLDEAAFAVHLPSPPADGSPRSATADTHPRFSEIFVGHFDTNRVANYFRKIAASTERHRDIDIFSFPLEGRTVRLALLGVGTAAVSNTDDPQVIRSMIDKYKEIALPFGGPALVKDYYKHVPLGTLAWSIARVSPSAPGKNSGLFILPGGYDLFFPGGSVIVASVRYTTGVHVKAEAFTTGEDEARRIAEQANAFLSIFRGFSQSMQPQGPDPDVKEFFDSLKVEQSNDRAILTASVPQGFIRKMLQEPPVGDAPLVQGAPAPTPEEQKTLPKKRPEKK
ncbi:MAG TPA: hypothetical protein VD837_15600 [Terriglobales bacterium]|nr:hypothetical protein [Terriglobales bacterium]